jgi:hypothetical protein
LKTTLSDGVSPALGDSVLVRIAALDARPAQWTCFRHESLVERASPKPRQERAPGAVFCEALFDERLERRTMVRSVVRADVQRACPLLKERERREVVTLTLGKHGAFHAAIASRPARVI